MTAASATAVTATASATGTLVVIYPGGLTDKVVSVDKDLALGLFLVLDGCRYRIQLALHGAQRSHDQGQDQRHADT